MNETKIAAGHNDMGSLAEDARSLITATAGVAGEKVSEARERLAAALERGKEMCSSVREKTIEGAEATDQAMHEHPYQAIGIAFGVGAFIGYMASRPSSRNDD